MCAPWLKAIPAGEAKGNLLKDHLLALSISRPVQELLSFSEHLVARVLARFRHACDLLTPGGDLVALVSPEVGDGPFNIVVDAPFQDIEPDVLAVWDGQVMQIGRLKLSLRGATVWEPCPDWEMLSARRSPIVERLPRLWRIAQRYAPQESLLDLAAGWRAGRPAPAKMTPALVLSNTVQRAARALAAGWGGDPVQLTRGAAQLAGLGGGLTPAGDDFLTGLMLWAWLAHPDPRSFCCSLAETAAPRTTTLSAAWLWAAAGGQCSACWHQLLTVLAEGAELGPAARQVLSHGATSGADTLAGFLWVVV